MKSSIHVSVGVLLTASWASAETPPTDEAEQGNEIIEVEGEAPTSSYAQSVDTTATKIAMPPREIPQTVQVLGRDLLDDAHIQSLSDAHKLAPGVVSVDTQYGTATSRGFDINWYDVRKDGFRVNTWSIRELTNVERIEYLKGPASVLYGDGSPGGLVNMVLERPRAKAAYSVETSFGVDGARGEIDLTGPIAKGFRYRINAAAEDLAGVQDGVRHRRAFLAPVVALDLGERTQLIIDSELWWDRSNSGSSATMAIDGKLGTVVPVRMHLGDTETERFMNRNFMIAPSIEHRFAGGWQLKSTLRATYIEEPDSISVWANELVDEYFIDRGIWISDGYHWGEYFNDTYLTGSFTTGRIGHQFVVGAETGSSDWAGGGRSYSGEAEGVPMLDLRAPVRGFAIPTGPAATWKGRGNVLRGGVYAQDLVTLAPGWKLLTGLRGDIYRERWSGEENMELSETNEVSHGMSPRVGLVFAMAPDAAAYASVTRSYQPQWAGQTAFDGTPFKPETGLQYELGAKIDARGGKLSLYGAVFNIARRNMLTKDPDHPMFSIAAGEVISRGTELNLSGELLPGWTMTAGYSLIEAFISEDNDERLGNQLPNAPRHQVTTWTQYALPVDKVRRVTGGVGATYVGDRAGDIDASFRLPGYTNVSAAVSWREKHYTIALSGDNLLDRDIAAGSWGPTYVTLGAPRTIRLGLAGRL